MSASWQDVLTVIGVQHLWQGAVLLLFAWGLLKQWPLNAHARSWIWLSAFAVAALSPLVVFLPGSESITPDLPRASAAVAALEEQVVVHASPSVADPWFSESLLFTLKQAAILAWLAGVVWNLSRLWRSGFAARRLRDTAGNAPGLERVLAGELPDNAMIKVSEQITGPMVVGLLHPCILVPRRLVAELSEAALRDILHHEIAHIRRRDLWTSLAQHIATAVYWWSPWLRLIGVQLELAREMACDAYAAQRSGEGKAYASSLLASADILLSSPQPRLLGSGILTTRKGLVQRIEGLLTMDTTTRLSSKPAWVLGAAVLTAGTILTLTATPRLGHALPAAMPARATDPTQVEQLIEAAEDGRLEDVRRLIRGGVHIDSAVPGDGTALIAAARANQPRIVNALVRMDADIDQCVRGDGNALIMAAKAGHLDLVAGLLTYGANVNAICRDDETPLINAAREGHLAVVEQLVERGADVNLGVRADFGRWRSPLNQARDPRVRGYLTRRGAVPGGP